MIGDATHGAPKEDLDDKGQLEPQSATSLLTDRYDDASGAWVEEEKLTASDGA